MPHCIIEYSDTLTTKIVPESLLNSVYLGAMNSQLFTADDIKSRLIPFQYFTAGVNKQDFIHVVIKILSGRTAEQRKTLSNSVLSELIQVIKSIPSPISLTVEVVEIEKLSYSKVVN